MNQPSQGQQGQRMQPLRPDQMRSISYLTPEEKLKYEDGLRALYVKMEQNGADTQEHQVAKQKIMEFSRMVYTKIKSLQSRSQANSQAQQGQPSNQPQVPQVGDQSSSAVAAPKPPQNRVQASGAGSTSMNPAASASGAAVAGNQQSPSIPKPLVEHINKMPWSLLRPPTTLAPERTSSWITEMKQRYLRFMMQMETLKLRMAKYEAILKERQEKNSLSPEEFKKLQDSRNQDHKNYVEAQRFVEGVRSQIRNAQNPQNGGAQGPSAQPGRGQPMPAQNVNTAATNHPMHAAAATVSAAMDVAKNQQIAASRHQQPQAQSAPQQQPGTPATPATPAIQSHPTSNTQPVQVKNEPSNSNMAHPPPPVNTALAAASSSAQLPSVGTPTQPSGRVQTPQSAGQQSTMSQVRPLSHAAAVNRANSSTNVTAQSNNSSGSVPPTTPAATGLVNNPSHASHSHAHPQPSTPALNSKMPIAKTLPAKATETPQAVSIGGGTAAGRPSYGGGSATSGGVMGQPVIAKMPAPQFDAEGEHVLSKKKLDELVRSVCGGAAPGGDGNYLTPDVEESVLNVADNFVDNVIHAACRLAKERGSKVLEIRDLQLVIERNYNIRIPGYTSDELRTVRKVQPANPWINKLHAIQAAKVMPGKDDK
ncbi:hypothetical protein GGR54DRAFT_609142 [Hypoxylon sp. NC1633]|nr:hypothetical protein GGR54DRAFT_609142 [Hypoxylon sp. NC1633]